MKFRRFDSEIYKKDLYLIPTIRFMLFNGIYAYKTFTIEIHVFIWHIRFIWIDKRAIDYKATFDRTPILKGADNAGRNEQTTETT